MMWMMMCLKWKLFAFPQREIANWELKELTELPEWIKLRDIIKNAVTNNKQAAAVNKKVSPPVNHSERAAEDAAWDEDEDALSWAERGVSPVSVPPCWDEH